MDEKKPEQEHSEGVEYTPSKEANVTHQSQANQMIAPTQIAGDSSSLCYPIEQLYPYQYNHQLQNQALQRQLHSFWEVQIKEIENTINFNHALPLARIKKIMKADDEVNMMIAAEAPVLFSKACEMFIMELTKRAWAKAEEQKRKTLKKSDITSAISRAEVYDFLVDIVPRDKTMEHELYVDILPRRGNDAEVVHNVLDVQNVPPPPLDTPHPYNYVPSPPPQDFGCAIPLEMVMARPPFDHPIHGQQPSYPYAPRGLQYPDPTNLMIRNSPDSNETKK